MTETLTDQDTHESCTAHRVGEFPKTTRAAAERIGQHIKSSGLETPGATPVVTAMRDHVVVTSCQPANLADWTFMLQHLPYRTRFRIRVLTDGRVSARIERLDVACAVS